MLFAKKPNAILFVERKSMAMHPKSAADPLAIPEELFKYMEIRDQAKFAELLSVYAKKANLRGKRVLIMLDKDLVFQKAITANKDDDKTLIAGYEHKMPLVTEDRHAIGLRQKDKLYVFGANKGFYRLIATILTDAGAKVSAVVPAVAFGVTDQGKLTHTKLDQIYNATALIKVVDFLADKKL